MMRRISGWDPSKGPLTPEGKPQLTSEATGLTGTMLEQVILPFRDSTGLRFIVRDADEKVRVMATDGTWSSASGAPTFSVIKDAEPFRLGPLGVFPTEEGLKAYEPDSTTTKWRFLGLKSPEDYVENEKLDVTRSAHAGTQLFDVVVGTTEWAVVGGEPGIGTANGTDYTNLVCYKLCEASQKSFTVDLDGTVDASGQSYLVMDMIMKYDGADPADAITKTGGFSNSHQTTRESGFELVLYSNAACSAEITRFAIPRLETGGVVNRVVFHLGTLPSTDILGLGVDTSAAFVPPAGAGTPSYQLWLYSFAFDDDWEHKGNYLYPPVKFHHSPWAAKLPPDPGTKVSGTTLPTSAVVLETFPESFDNFSPDHPRVKWQYNHRGRSALSITDYDVMVSDPSAESLEYFADPWRAYLLTTDLPTTGGEDVTDQYGKYVTNCLLYRKVYTGLGQDDIVDVLGTWSLGTFCGKPSINNSVACTLQVAANTITTTAAHDLYLGAVIKFGTTIGGITAGTTYYVRGIPTTTTFEISTSYDGAALDITGDEEAANTWSTQDLYYYDMGRSEYACTLNDSGDTISATGHKFYIGDIVKFGTTTSGITKNRLYYVITTDDWNTFQVSETVDGSAVTITGDVSNTVSNAGKDLTIDELDIPQYIPVNRAIPDDAKFAVPAHNRVYTAHLTYDAAWTRQTMMQASNLGDHGSMPVVAVDEATDGQELGKFSPESYTIRGLLTKDNFLYVGTERGFWELLGTDANSPWQFHQRAAVGWVSNKTAVACPTEIIWHGPDEDGFHSYRGGLTVPISEGIIDSSLIDWTKAHQGVFSQGRYVFFCRYDDTDEEDAWGLFIYDIANDAWHSAHDECYEYAGMCVDDATGDVYALTHDGDIVSVFGSSTTSYGSANSNQAVYTAEYQHVIAAPPTEMRQTAWVAADIITAETSIEMELTVSRQGKGDSVPVEARAVTIRSDQTQYRWPVGIDGDAFAAKLVYRGTTPPDVSYFVVYVNEPVKA
jgi:hypothetical protein